VFLFNCLSNDPNQQAEPVAAVCLNQKPKKDRQQQRRRDRIHAHGKARERTCELVDLQGARRADPMRRDTHCEASRRPVLDAEDIHDRRPDHGTNDTG
jgi:hypothetical protein